MKRAAGYVAFSACVFSCASAPTPRASPSPDPEQPVPRASAPAAVSVAEASPPAPADPPEAPPAPEPSACPAPEHGTHCLWIATTPPNPFRARHVTARLKKDGFDAIADGDRIIVRADDSGLEKLFGGEPSHGLSPASASDRMRCVAKLPEGARLNARYAGEVGDFVLDDPTCEL